MEVKSSRLITAAVALHLVTSATAYGRTPVDLAMAVIHPVGAVVNSSGTLGAVFRAERGCPEAEQAALATRQGASPVPGFEGPRVADIKPIIGPAQYAGIVSTGHGMADGLEAKMSDFGVPLRRPAALATRQGASPVPGFEGPRVADIKPIIGPSMRASAVIQTSISG